MHVEKNEEQKEKFAMTLSGKMVYEIYLEENKFNAKYESCNENNLISLMMTKEIITYLVERNSNPNLPKAEKLKGEKFRDLCKAAIIVNDLAEQIGGHLIKKGLEGKYKPEIIVPDKPKIIMP